MKSRIQTTTVLLIGIVLTLGTLFFSYSSKGFQFSLTGPRQSSSDTNIGAFPITEPNLKFGIVVDTFIQTIDTIRHNQFLADILLRNKVEYTVIDQVVRNAEGIFDIRHFKVNQPYTILSADTSQSPEYFIYEPSVFEYVVFHLKDDHKVERIEKEVDIELRSTGGIIESSLWNAIVGQGKSYELAVKMEDALQWSIDFNHLQQNDAFKLIYEEQFIDGESVGIGQVFAAYFKNMDREFHAMYYDLDAKNRGYYDLEGRPMKKTFLKSPVKSYRISSYYNLNRFHPILKRRRPHLGTDYAAPYGTPIHAVGNGLVTRVGYTKGNGNYVKIKHDDTYETQYLHMQKFAKGMRPGVHVQQNEVIGYVGATGLATGPHVCFRFWKNGKQINFTRLTFPPSDPLPEQELPGFFKVRDQYLTTLDQVVLPKIIEQEATEIDNTDNP